MKAQRMSDERWAEIVVDDGYPMTDLEIELMQALKAERAKVGKQGERILGLEVIALETAKQLDKSLAIVERVEKIVCRMEILPQKLAYTRGIAAEFRDALHPQEPKDG